MIEAFISILITFGGFFLIRFIDRGFSYLVITSSGIMYLSYYIMVAVCLYELIFVKNKVPISRRINGTIENISNDLKNKPRFSEMGIILVKNLLLVFYIPI